MAELRVTRLLAFITFQMLLGRTSEEYRHIIYKMDSYVRLNMLIAKNNILKRRSVFYYSPYRITLRYIGKKINVALTLFLPDVTIATDADVMRIYISMLNSLFYLVDDV